MKKVIRLHNAYLFVFPEGGNKMYDFGARPYLPFIEIGPNIDCNDADQILVVLGHYLAKIASTGKYGDMSVISVDGVTRFELVSGKVSLVHRGVRIKTIDFDPLLMVLFSEKIKVDPEIMHLNL